MPQVAAVTVLQPQHVSAAGRGGPHVHGQASHVGAEHVVVEAQHAVRPGGGGLLRGTPPPPSQGGPEHRAEEDRRVPEGLGGRGLDVQVVAPRQAQRVVLPGARAQGGGGAPRPGPVEDVGPAGVLGPAAQALLEVALELRSWGPREVL